MDPHGRALVQKLPDGRAPTVNLLEHGVEARVMASLNLQAGTIARRQQRSTRMSEPLCTLMSIFLRILLRVRRNSKRQVMGDPVQPGGA